MPSISILGTGRYQPQSAISNEMLREIVDTNDEWITGRTGIKTRAMAGAEETSLSMAAAAARGALEQSGVAPAEIGTVICATLSGDYLTPSLACLLQKELGLPESVIAMDLNCACSGFVYALNTAYALLALQEGKAALVVGCEMLTRITDYTDRATCIIFGDGAGAVVARRTAEGRYAFDAGCRGDEQLLVCKAQYLANNPFVDRKNDRVPDGLFMNGTEVFRFALEAAGSSVQRCLARVGVSVDEIDHFVFHQANKRIVDGLARRLGAEQERCFLNISYTGNTSAASVAIALDELNRSGKLKRGDKVVLTAFGGGLTYASLYLEW